MPQVQFEDAESLGRVAMRGAVGGKFGFVVPVFGRACVCCNADAMFRTQPYDPSTDAVTAPPIDMPVCFECRSHALQTHTGPIIAGSLVCVGGALAALAGMKLDERPNDDFLWAMLFGGIAVAVAAIAWIIAGSRRQKRHRERGHHAGLSFSIDHGATVLTTTNEELVADLLERNPGARRVLTRAERRRIPEARTVDDGKRDGNRRD